MMNIPVPLAVSIAVAAVPSIASVLVALKMSRRRKPAKEAAHIKLEKIPDATDFDYMMHQQLLDQQIDTIFHGLTALVESECTKLKAVTRSWSMAALENKLRSPVACEKTKLPVTQKAETEAQTGELRKDRSDRKDDLGEKISACIEQRMTPEEISRKLNLSLIEVSLAMRMRGVERDNRNPIQRMKALA